MSDPSRPAVTTAPPAPVLPPGRASRRGAWLGTAAVLALVLVYLTLWWGWASVHTAERYRQLPPGATGNRGDADYTVLGLQRTDRLRGGAGERPQQADAGTTFVVAAMSVTRRRSGPPLLCSVDLLGPGGRLWSPTLPQVQRAAPSCDTDDVVVGRPYRFESVFVVPAGDADQIRGVALTDRTSADRTPVLRPAG